MKVKCDWAVAEGKERKLVNVSGARLTTPGKPALRYFGMQGTKLSLAALRDVILERSGQIDAYPNKHDKGHGIAELIGAAINYAEAGAGRPENALEGAKSEGWQRDWVKGKNGQVKPARQWCIEAAALLIAACDLMDEQERKRQSKKKK